MFLLLAACSGGEGENLLSLSDEDSHALSLSLDVPTTTVEPLTDWEVAWGDVASDLGCSEAEPEHTRLSLIKFSLSEEALLEVLASDGFRQADQSGFVTLDLTDQSSPSSTSEMGFFGTVVEPTEELTAGSTYLFVYEEVEPDDAYDHISVHLRTLSLAVVVPEEGAGTDSITMEDGCGMADIDAEFAEPVSLGSATTLDLSAVSSSAPGGTIGLAWFEGIDAEELETGVLMTDATETWEATLDADRQVSVDALEGLAELSEDGTWVLWIGGLSIFDPPDFLVVLAP